MLVGLGIAKAFQRTSRDLDSATRGARKRKSPVRLMKPKNFISYEDPKKRFELHYPSDWTLEKHNGIHISSSKIFSFARVDVGKDEKRIWSHVKKRIEEAGGEMKLERRQAGSPEKVRGEVSMEGIRFRYDGYAWHLGKEAVILSMGNVIEPKRSRAIEKFEDTILEGIRRHFWVNQEKKS